MGQMALQPPKSAPGINDNIDVGPPAFQPGVPWKGYRKQDNLDPDKNPDLTPAMLAEMQKEQQNQKNQGVSYFFSLKPDLILKLSTTLEYFEILATWWSPVLVNEPVRWWNVLDLGSSPSPKLELSAQS